MTTIRIVYRGQVVRAMIPTLNRPGSEHMVLAHRVCARAIEIMHDRNKTCMGLPKVKHWMGTAIVHIEAATTLTATDAEDIIHMALTEVVDATAWVGPVPYEVEDLTQLTKNGGQQ